MSRRGREARRGRVVARVLALMAVAYALFGGLRHYHARLRAAAGCQRNLRAIYRALERYEVEHGELPKLDFFPEDPLGSSSSLTVLLGQQGIGPEFLICPAMPASYHHLGLTYVWNLALSGKPLPRGEEPTWMVAEVTALDPDIRLPHFGACQALYTDGSVRRVSDPRRQLTGLAD